MTILRTVDALRDAVARWKATGETVGVVPTMGALHAGHLSLVSAARADCDRVIVTIFVNPSQFGDPGDLAKYPRTEEADAALLARFGVDAIFAPGVAEVYPEGFSTMVRVGRDTAEMEGAHRPGHFDGVATVVTKLFGMTRADRAYFGQKDWQQLHVVRRLVADLNLPVAIVGCETVREADGLALSSRNARLDADARALAPALHRALQAAAAAILDGGDARVALDDAGGAIIAGGFSSVDYIELRDADTLAPTLTGARPARLLVAATIGGVRLIDTIAVQV